MRKMKKINGYLVVRFNDREKREYEGAGLGNFGVIDAELYTGILDVDRSVMEYDDIETLEIALEQARGLESELDVVEPEVKITVIIEGETEVSEEDVEPESLFKGHRATLEAQLRHGPHLDLDPLTAAHELHGYARALEDLGMIDGHDERFLVERNTFGATAPPPDQQEEALEVMELLVGDEHTFDLWVQYTAPNGKVKAVRPVLVGIVVARSGYGKTYALREYAKLPRVAYIECDDTMSSRDLVEAIERSIGLPNGYGTIWRRVNGIREFFNTNRGYLLIIDEADKLVSKYTQKKMEILRAIFDQSDVGLVIAGEPKLEAQIKTYLARMANRVDFYASLRGLAPSEVEGYLEDFNITPDALLELKERACNMRTGCFRLLDRTLSNVGRILAEQGEDTVTVKIIEQ